MGKRKRKFSEIRDNYNKFKIDDREIKRLYEEVKQKYLENENLDITLEKIYLDENFKGSKSTTLNTNLTIFISMATAIITIMLDRAITGVLSGVLMFFMVGGAWLLFFYLLDKALIYLEKDKYIYYNVCIKVLEEIEKERGTLQKNVSSL